MLDLIDLRAVLWTCDGMMEGCSEDGWRKRETLAYEHVVLYGQEQLCSSSLLIISLYALT